jgi:hypothetical protein
MDGSAMKKFKEAYAGKPITAERLNDIYVFYLEQAHEVKLKLEQPELLRDPVAIREAGLRACRDAETVLGIASVFYLLTEEQYKMKLDKLTSVATDIFTSRI